MHKLVVMGVSGCGKSTLGGALARELGYVRPTAQLLRLLGIGVPVPP